MWFRTVIFIVVAVIISGSAHAHAPYFESKKKSLVIEGQQYRPEIWVGDGVIGPNPKRGVLRADNGGFAAISPDLGHDVVYLCARADNCNVLTFDGIGIIPDIARLDQTQINATPQAWEGRYGYGYPDDWKEDFFGFERTNAYWLIPIAWLCQGSLYLCLLLLFAMWLPIKIAKALTFKSKAAHFVGLPIRYILYCAAMLIGALFTFLFLLQFIRGVGILVFCAGVAAMCTSSKKSLQDIAE